MSSPLRNIADQLEEIKLQLLDLKRSGRVQAPVLWHIQGRLHQLENMSSEPTAFKVWGDIPRGQAYLHGLLESCYDLVRQLNLRLPEPTSTA